MRCRKIVDGNIIWFSKDSFSSDIQAISDSLTQKLSVLKNELWYDYNKGIPLLEKVKAKSIIDTAIIQTVKQQQGVEQIISFSSSVSGRDYSCKTVLGTIYGDISLTL